MPGFATSNYQCAQELNSLVARLNAGMGIRLFQNPLNVTPSTLNGDFIESSFAGYARQSTLGMFNTPIKIATGVYGSVSNPFVFPCTDPNNQNVYGWYIWPTSNWIYAQTFDIPLLVNQFNNATFTITLILQSLSVACP